MKGLRLARLAANQSWQHALSDLSVLIRHPVHKPSKVRFEIVTVCNLRCIHCDVWTNRRDPNKLRLGEWLRLLRELKEWIGFFTLSFSSGEPLVEPDFFPLLEEASALGILTTCVSNGTLITDETARRLCESGLDSLHISLDGVREETHDLGRGVPGTFRRVMAAIGRLKRFSRRPLLKISTIVAGHNLEELEALVRWTAAEGLAGIGLQPLREGGDRWRELWPRDLVRLRAAIDRLVALKREGFPVLNAVEHLTGMKDYFSNPGVTYPERTCGSLLTLGVKTNGDVQFCNYKAAFGNVRRSDVRTLWDGAQARERFLEVLACKRSCILSNCHFKPGLRARGAEFLRHAKA